MCCQGVGAIYVSLPGALLGDGKAFGSQFCLSFCMFTEKHKRNSKICVIHLKLLLMMGKRNYNDLLKLEIAAWIFICTFSEVD